MLTSENTQTAEVLDALEAAVALALAAGFTADEVIDTVGAMVYPANPGTE